MQNEDLSKNADVICSVDISPEFKIELTPASFARLMLVIESIVSVSENIVLAVEKAHFSPDNRPFESSVSLNLINPLSPLSNFITNLSGIKLNRQKNNLLNNHQLRQQLHMTVNIPSISLIMKFDLQQHHLSVVLNDLSGVLIARPLDLTTDFHVSHLNVQDSSRPEGQRFVLWNDLKNTQSDTRILIKVTKVFDKKSPLYDNTGAKIDINLAYLLLCLNSNTILHIRPFLDSFLAYTMMNKSKRAKLDYEEFHDVPLTLQQAHRISSNLLHTHGSSSHADKKNNNNSNTLQVILNSVNISFCIQQISIEVLRPILDDRKGLGGMPESKTLIDSVYRINLDGTMLGINVVNDLLGVDVAVRNCMIEDTRSISKDFPYKEIVTTTYDRSFWVPKIDKNLISPKDSFFIRSQTTSNKSSNFFTVKYQEESANKSKIHIDISRTAVFFSVDSFLDSLHVSLQNAFSIMKLVQICEERETFVSDSLNSIIHSNNNNTSNSVEFGNTFTTNQESIAGIVKIINSEESASASSVWEEIDSSLQNIKTKPPRPDENVHLEVFLRDPIVFLLEDPSIGRFFFY